MRGYDKSSRKSFPQDSRHVRVSRPQARLLICAGVMSLAALIGSGVFSSTFREDAEFSSVPRWNVKVSTLPNRSTASDQRGPKFIYSLRPWGGEIPETLYRVMENRTGSRPAVLTSNLKSRSGKQPEAVLLNEAITKNKDDGGFVKITLMNPCLNSQASCPGVASKMMPGGLF